MADSILSAPYFHNEEAAYEFVEARVWPKGPVCPHCGGVERIGRMGGKSTRIGSLFVSYPGDKRRGIPIELRLTSRHFGPCPHSPQNQSCQMHPSQFHEGW